MHIFRGELLNRNISSFAVCDVSCGRQSLTVARIKSCRAKCRPSQRSRGHRKVYSSLHTEHRTVHGVDRHERRVARIILSIYIRNEFSHSTVHGHWSHVLSVHTNWFFVHLFLKCISIYAIRQSQWNGDGFHLLPFAQVAINWNHYLPFAIWLGWKSHKWPPHRFLIWLGFRSTQLKIYGRKRLALSYR